MWLPTTAVGGSKHDASDVLLPMLPVLRMAAAQSGAEVSESLNLTVPFGSGDAPVPPCTRAIRTTPFPAATGFSRLLSVTVGCTSAEAKGENSAASKTRTLIAHRNWPIPTWGGRC